MLFTQTRCHHQNYVYILDLFEAPAQLVLVTYSYGMIPFYDYV